MSDKDHRPYVGGDRPLADDPVRGLVRDEDVSIPLDPVSARSEYDRTEEQARAGDTGEPRRAPILDNANAAEDGVPRAAGPLTGSGAAPPARDNTLGDAPYADREGGGYGEG